MIQQILEWLRALGLPGLFLAMFLEGLSIPFPGVVIVLSFGYLLSPGLLSIALISIGMSIFYSIASLIPFFLASKLGGHLPKRIKKGLEKGQSYFNRYGVWSIAISRPFGIGNYISYVAGLSKVNPLKYFLLTFIGIYPWSFIMMFLGDYFNGNFTAIKQFFKDQSIYGYAAAFIVILIGLFYIVKKYKKSKDETKTAGDSPK
ncbi:hypothetical protein CIL05_17995 [Virgibacillus profundi]|uniref:VTT domain-containing protein n=1 Tax=Virgibacillus profundi TaxID=2024555 RepID=A0A2A2I962_9BACI|nr:DedA family protein [Virgibacillus profundi]PAV28259.1 hypothetical protein CIL05_17995 [Virgibacillus profundi]PXY52563.1 DedA family protein [Virgibacillus profundi]